MKFRLNANDHIQLGSLPVVGILLCLVEIKSLQRNGKIYD